MCLGFQPSFRLFWGKCACGRLCMYSRAPAQVYGQVAVETAGEGGKITKRHLLR